MKLEAVTAAVQAYQGSVPGAASASGSAKTPKAPNTSGSAKASRTVSTSGAVKTPGTAGMSNRTQSRKAEAEDGKVIKREVEDPDSGGKIIISDEESERDIPENTGVQQNSKQLQEAVDKLKEKMAANTEAVFGIHEGTNRVMIKIVDKATKDVIKEYPPEKTLDMIQKVWEMAGIMVDEKL